MMTSLLLYTYFFSYFFRHDNDDDGDPPAIESTKEGTVISTKLRRHDAQ